MQFHRPLLGILSLVGIVGLFPQSAEAALPNLTYRYTHLLTTIPARDMTEWQGQKEQWTYRGQPIDPPAFLRVDGDSAPALPDGFARSLQPMWDEAAIARTIAEKVSPGINRPAGTVTISRSASGNILFDGVGFPGRNIDLHAAAHLTAQALTAGVTDITLPVIETQPTLIVNDP